MLRFELHEDVPTRHVHEVIMDSADDATWPRSQHGGFKFHCFHDRQLLPCGDDGAVSDEETHDAGEGSVNIHRAHFSPWSGMGWYSWARLYLVGEVGPHERECN